MLRGMLEGIIKGCIWGHIRVHASRGYSRSYFKRRASEAILGAYCKILNLLSNYYSVVVRRAINYKLI